MKTVFRRLVFFIVLSGLVSLFEIPPVLAQKYNHGGALDARQHGYEHGYRDGYESGHVSRLSNRDQDIRNQQLRAQGNGYQPYFGSEMEYSQGYLEGFDDGARDSSNGVRSRLDELFRSPDPGYNPDRSRLDPGDEIYRDNHWRLEHIANDIGYRDGVNAGSQDLQRGRAYRPRQRAAWKN